MRKLKPGLYMYTDGSATVVTADDERGTREKYLSADVLETIFEFYDQQAEQRRFLSEENVYEITDSRITSNTTT